MAMERRENGGIEGVAKYAAVAVLGCLAGSGLTWAIAKREPAPIVSPTPSQPIIVQPAPIVINMPQGGLLNDGLQNSGTQSGGSQFGPNVATNLNVHPGVIVITPEAPTVPSPIWPNGGPNGGGGSGPLGDPVTQPTRTARLNINKATAAEIELLPGIGPALAGRILAHRAAKGPFRSIMELDDVDGIGPKILERLAPLVSVE